ncbi:16092_t:CDS:1, partial [Racocetra persica]
PYELVFGGILHGDSAIIDQLFKNNISCEDEISDEFNQENFQELIYDLDDLIYDSLPVVESSVDLIQDSINSNLNDDTDTNLNLNDTNIIPAILIVESSSQNSSLDSNLDNLIDNHNNMPVIKSSLIQDPSLT